jgi:hypothetical protein
MIRSNRIRLSLGIWASLAISGIGYAEEQPLWCNATA